MPGQPREWISKLFLSVRQKPRRRRTFTEESIKEISKLYRDAKTNRIVDLLTRNVYRCYRNFDTRVVFLKTHMNTAFWRKRNMIEQVVTYSGQVIVRSQTWIKQRIWIRRSVRFYFYVTRNSIALQAKGCAHTLVARNFISRNEETWSDSAHANARYKK